MKRLLKKNAYLIAAVTFLISAFLLEKGSNEKGVEQQMIQRFQRNWSVKERSMDHEIENLKTLSTTPGFVDFILSEMAAYNQPLERGGVGYLVYCNRKLIYWSDRAVAFQEILPPDSKNGKRLSVLPNGNYLSVTSQKDSFTIVGYILIKYDYVHENQYLRNGFFRDFRLPADYRVDSKPTEGGYDIRGTQHEYLFTIIPGNSTVNPSWSIYLPGILYLMALLLVLHFLGNLFFRWRWGFWARLLMTGSFLVVIYAIHIKWQFPAMYSQIDYFSPSLFAWNSMLPSLGDFLLISFFILYLSVLFYRASHIPLGIKATGLYPSLRILPVYGVAALIWGLIISLVEIFIDNSSFSFTLNQINEITVPTFLGILAIMFLLFSLILLSIKTAAEILKSMQVNSLPVVLIIVALLSSLVQYFITGRVNTPSWILFLVVSLLSVLFVSLKTRKYQMSFLVLFITVIAAFSIFLIYSITDKKEKDVQKLLAITLVAEHDPAAEVFLVEIQQQIKNDPNMQRYLVSPFDKLVQYIETTYFSGFFRQYDLQITVCSAADSVIIRPQNTKSPCYAFFDSMIKNQGILLPGTDFYYMDNMDGRISYFGRLNYSLPDAGSQVSIFIDLKSKEQSEGVGFPELLIDQSMRKPANYKRYQYAKYFGGELVNRHGNFPYNFYIYSYDFEDNEFTFTQWDGFEHLIHKTRENNYVIVSRSLYRFNDYLISFPYLFVLYFLSSLTILFLIHRRKIRWKIMLDLKFRIQAAIISIVFISLLLVAAGTIFYNLRESGSRLRSDLDQKMNSISVELDLHLQNETSFYPAMNDWLLPELVKLSNVFQTDINIFGVNGDLVASSRPEIFNRGLVSRKINTQAYYELYENFQTNYFQPEKIGELSYLSAYEPIINNRGEYLGFINLPFFTHQDKYSQEISTFVVAFINLYVLLFLASLVVAVFFANQITLPLVTIRENLRKIELGKRHEHIHYQRDDEIGKLVKEYNKKVDELVVSAELLARSERESAWREMAKQVAHEIKNPLTPMKLNIQHLQRFRGEGKEYTDYVNRISQILINQIDTLSDIATEFSSFAQIPTAIKQVFPVAEQIGKVIELYTLHDNVTISFLKNDCDGVLINADREQLSRALINLIKNGIQAIPENREGKIIISLEKKEQAIIISVEDNGSGIPAELQEKMFSPNFTTKSSGMGLGLAIVKNIAENFNGRVWYETRQQEGTTFYFEIPVYNESPKP